MKSIVVSFLAIVANAVPINEVGSNVKKVDPTDASKDIINIDPCAQAHGSCTVGPIIINDTDKPKHKHKKKHHKNTDKDGKKHQGDKKHHNNKEHSQERP